MSIKEELRNFLGKESFYSERIADDFADDFQLIESGALDSIGIFSLVVFIEKRFKIAITIDDISSSTFATLTQIEKFVQCKIALHGTY
jgi:acyl carrier protein